MNGEFNFLAQKLLAALHGANRILLISHGECGDGYGSSVAMAHYLRSLGKSVQQYLAGGEPNFVSQFFPSETFIHHSADISWTWPDLILILDLAEIKMAKLQTEILFLSEQNLIPIWAIDHHRSHSAYSENLILDASASANTVILARLFQIWNYSPMAEIATALLLGIFYDTGVLSNAGTNEETLTLTKSLAQAGAARAAIIRTLKQRSRSLMTIKLWAEAMSRSFVDQDKILVIPIMTDLFPHESIADIAGELGGLSNIISSVFIFSDQVKGLLVLRDDNLDAQGLPFVTGSYRTTRDDIDMIALAAKYGGGGHQKAAGFSAPGKIILAENNWRITSV